MKCLVEGNVKQRQPPLTATREGLSEQNNVGTDVLVITGKQFTSSAQALHTKAYQLGFRGRNRRAYGLDFVTNQ